jgi:uracil-DNA glycosylase family 4
MAKLDVPPGYDLTAWLTIRNEDCEACKLHQTTRVVCETGLGQITDKVWVVSKVSNSESYQRMIEEALRDVGVDPGNVYFTQAIKCKTFDQDASRSDVKACKSYLEAEIAEGKPEWILVFGNEALSATTGHSGITKYRTKVIERQTADGHTYRVIPTISPAAVNRNPGQKNSWLADLQFFGAQVNGKAARVDRPGILYVDTKKKFNQLKTILDRTKRLSYDIETNGYDEFAPDAAIVSLAGTSELDNGRIICWALPLFHPQSPFRSSWQRILEILARYIRKIPIQIAHNGKFDARWLRQFRVPAKVTFDTMLACHILDENRLKGLKPQATSRLGVADWSVDTGKLLEMPIKEVLKYNALDTFYTWHVYLDVKDELIAQQRLLRIFQKLTMPANEMLIEAERRGIWRDPQKLATAIKISHDMRDEIERQLMEWVPEPGTHGWPTKGKTDKPVPLNFNPSNWSRWWLFDYLKLPVLESGKTGPSMREAVMLELREEHPAVQLLLDRVKWQKYATAFLPAYNDLADAQGRIHTTFKLAGTVTGRLSSGKPDEEKVRSKAIRGVNIQQVPRDPMVRGIFGAQPGYDFVEADFSQIELRVVAFISRDRTMIRLYQLNQDIHTMTASNVLGIPASEITKDARKKAKAVNFGFVYGMGWRKFIATAFEKYDAVFSPTEAQQVRKLFFEQFSGLLPWHARQRRLVAQNGRVQSPLGRIRHLPDIYSEEEGVRAEAERQAINSPVQSFASDMTMFSMLMINEKFKELNLDAHVIGTVHDSLLFEVNKKHTAKALPIIKDTMENLPLQKKFGVYLDVPIVSDLAVGTHWGEARELTPEEVYDYRAA